MKTPKKFLQYLFSCLSLLVAEGTVAAEPSKLSLQLPTALREFTPYSIAFSSTGERACVAGTDYDEMGTSTGRLLLVDFASNNVVWQRSIVVPDGFAQITPVQCIVAADRVYVLANVDTSSSPPQAHTFAYVMSFDMHGVKVASVQVQVPGANRYGYAIGLAGDGIQVAGYTQDTRGDTESYGTYTVRLSEQLQHRGAPVMRKTGAYTSPLGAGMVGDSIFLSGRFFNATASKSDLGRFAASRLRMEGGYSWSLSTGLNDNMDVKFAVMDDGTSYAMGSDRGVTSLGGVNPQGKMLAPLTYASMYCRTNAIAGYREGILAVRSPCSGQANGLVYLDRKAGKERLLAISPDNPVFVATHGTAWAVMASDKQGKLYLYFSTAGEL